MTKGDRLDMKPGDRDPNRYVGKSKVPTAIKALAAGGASVAVIYAALISYLESSGKVRTKAYLDGAGIWTICDGLTNIFGRPVNSRDVLTEEQCKQLDMQWQAQGLVRMRKLVGPEVWDRLTPASQAALASWCEHNLGITKCSTSSAIRELKAGRLNEACAAITLWIRDGGKDCRIRENGCLGQVDRRQIEDELCLDSAPKG